MANEVRIRASVKDDASQPLGRIGAAWKQFQDSGSKGGFAIGASAAVAAKGLDLISGAAFGAGQAVGDFIGDSIKAASDLNESTSKSQVIFGDAAKAVSDFAETADKSLGLSKAAALDAAASFGNLFLGTGQSQAKAAELSKTLVTLAGDLASFNNLDPTDTLQKLRSGLTGEAEPLRAVGVFLTEAKVKAKAMELGLADAHGELSEGAKVMARYQIILDETKSAQGDFARTADGVANSQRSLNAEIENTKAALGEKILPLEKAWLGIQLDLVTGINHLSDSLSGKATPAMIAMAAESGKVAMIAEKVRDQIGDLDEATLAAGVQFGIFTQAQADAEMASRKVAAGTKYMASHVKDDSAEAALAFQGIGTKAEKASMKVQTSMSDIVNAVQDARDDLEGAASDAADAIYNPIIARGELAAIERERSEQKQIISAKNSTKEQVADAKLRLAELNKDKIKRLAELASYGDTSAKKTLTTMISVLESTENLSAEQREELRLLRLALNATGLAYDRLKAKAAGWVSMGKMADDLALPGRATGGPVSAGKAYIVGEHKPEVFVPDTNGYILPEVPTSPSGGSGWGGGISISPTIVVQGIATPAIREQIARELGPLIADVLRRNGYG